MRYWKINTRIGQEEEKENLGYRIDQVKNAWPLTGKENKFFLKLRTADALGTTSGTYKYFENDLSELFLTRAFCNRNWPGVPSY